MRFLCRHIGLRPGRVIVLFYVPRQSAGLRRVGRSVCCRPSVTVGRLTSHSVSQPASAGQSVVVLQSQSAVLRLMLTLPVSRPPSRRPVYMLLSFSHSRPSYVSLCQSAGLRRVGRSICCPSVTVSRRTSASQPASVACRPVSQSSLGAVGRLPSPGQFQFVLTVSCRLSPWQRFRKHTYTTRPCRRSGPAAQTEAAASMYTESGVWRS